MQSVDADRGSAAAFDVGDVFAIVRRRKWIFIIPAALILAIVVPVAFILPREYESKAIILIDQPDIPPELVTSTVTTLADQRIKVIEQRFKATANLVRIIDKYDLYPDERDVTPTTEIVDRMRDKIAVDLISANVMDPRGGRAHQATIAFSVAFDYRDPVTAQRVASELVSWYLNENTRERQEQAQQTAAFLSSETAALERKVADLEAKMAAFKEKYAGSLPEEEQTNRETLARLQAEMRDLDLRAAALSDRRAAVDMQLGFLSTYVPPTTNGAGALSPAARLRAAQAELQSLKGRYSDDHPDVIKLSNEIASLKEEVAADSKADAAGAGSAAANADVLDNPQLIQLKSQLQSIESEGKALAKRREFLESEISNVRERLARTPLVEQDYNTLARSLENAHTDYLAVRGKRLAANLGESLESEGKSEKFDVIEPPSLPVEPERPNRAMIIGGGAAFAVAFGAGLALLAELLDPTIRSRKYLIAKTGTQPLAAIPYIRTRAEAIRLWMQRIGVSTALVASLAGGLAYVHYKVKPLDVAIVAMERKLDAQVTRILR